MSRLVSPSCEKTGEPVGRVRLLMECGQNGREPLQLDSRQLGEVEAAAIEEPQLEQQLSTKIADVLGRRVEPALDSGLAGSGWPHAGTDRTPVAGLGAERLDEVLLLEAG